MTTVIPLGENHKPPQPDLGPLRGRSVLIVDDEADIRSLVGMMLNGRGVDSITTDTADGALEVLREFGDQIAVVLLDLSIPNSTAEPALDRLRREYPHTPVIVMSGMAPDWSEQGTSGNELVSYLRKPFRPDALYSALAQRGRRAGPSRSRFPRDSGGRRGSPPGRHHIP